MPVAIEIKTQQDNKQEMDSLACGTRHTGATNVCRSRRVTRPSQPSIQCIATTLLLVSQLLDISFATNQFNTLISALNASETNSPQETTQADSSRPLAISLSESKNNKDNESSLSETEINKVFQKTPVSPEEDQGSYQLVPEVHNFVVDSFWKTNELDTEDEQSEVSNEKPASLKYRRQAVADWWTKLGSTPKGNSKPSSKKSNQPSGKGKKTTDRKSFGDKTPVAPKVKPNGSSTVYKEQPLNQNAILTVKYQLAAIRSKHRLLVTQSIQQLYQLDHKLIDAYKLCLKKKMPLYAGMLYRTRDFVTRMGKEVNHERKVLEAMTEQVKGVLKQKMSNRTILREYNKLVATSTETPLEMSQSKAQHTKHDHFRVTNLIEQSLKIESKRGTLTRIRKENLSQKVESVGKSQEQQVDQDSTEKTLNDVVSTTQSPSAKGYAHVDKSRTLKELQQNPANELEVDTVAPSSKCNKNGTSNNNQPSKLRKPIKYKVHVNEVNLKKELTKIQALVDRINSSSHELNAVVDDIVFLFRLNESANRKVMQQTGKGGSKSDKSFNQQSMDFSGVENFSQHLKRSKMLKSPIRNFLEKYGRMTVESAPTGPSKTTTPSSGTNTFDGAYPPDLKPLFNSSSLNYTEDSEDELGFEYSDTVEHLVRK